MANMYDSAQGDEASGYIRVLHVGTADLVTEIKQQFCDTTHANTADPYKMYMFVFPVHIR
jgi:hypothetical protein